MYLNAIGRKKRTITHLAHKQNIKQSIDEDLSESHPSVI